MKDPRVACKGRSGRGFDVKCRDVSSQFRDGFLSYMGFTPCSWESLILTENELPMDCSTGEFLRHYWFRESFSKMPVLLDGVDRDKVALATFVESEAQCRASNERTYDVFTRPSADRFLNQLKTARRLLINLLSDITRDEVVESAGWGPGASTSVRRRDRKSVV